ncbi:NUDIX hydrolase [candidate division KSB1 bacterium]|nr:NUDIX hydrolase [candidate division KSB1 bacterium]
MKVEIIKRETIFKGFFTLEKAKLRFEKFDNSMSEQVSRLNVYRGDAVSVLLYNSVKKTLLFVKQFRYPIFTVEPENAWTLEAVAGSIENDHTPVETAVKEVEEEVGYKLAPHQLEYIGKCYPSPGGTSERIYLYIADIAGCYRTNGGGGLDHEAEDIQVVELSYKETLDRIKSFDLCDAKTLISLSRFKSIVETVSP